jgi:CheY-specific phosphatase CheX
MTSNTLPLDHEITAVIEVVERRTISFMKDQLGLKASAIVRRLLHKEPVVLRAMTAIVGVGSKAGLYIAYSYERSLITAMMRRYTEGLTVSADEEELYVRETASDVVNVIVGNCTADLAKRKELITLSPPVLVDGARTIQGRGETTIAAITVRFPEGELDIAFVGPRLMFDEHLNYKGGRS